MEYQEKTTDLSQVTDKFQHIMLYLEYTSPLAGFGLTIFVVIGIDCTCSYKSNYHTITTTTVLFISPGQRPDELLASLGVHSSSVVNFHIYMFSSETTKAF